MFHLNTPNQDLEQLLKKATQLGEKIKQNELPTDKLKVELDEIIKDLRILVKNQDKNEVAKIARELIIHVLGHCIATGPMDKILEVFKKFFE